MQYESAVRGYPGDFDFDPARFKKKYPAERDPRLRDDGLRKYGKYSIELRKQRETGELPGLQVQ